jgi:uncharacterized membrane protein YkoI
MKAVRALVIAAMALVVGTGALLAHGQETGSAASRVAVSRKSPRRVEVSMAQAVRRAQHHFKARVVRAETRTQGDRTIYVLRMLDDAGRVFAVRVDAVSGAFI